VLPIVGVVEDDIEHPASERLFQRLGIVTVRLKVAYFLAEIVFRLTMQDGNFMAGLS
jgi:hypothetical protein